MSRARNLGPAVTIIGAGPAGLMAAEVISRAGLAVNVYDAMPSPARKFLRAGVGGLNLTHSEAFEQFVSRYAGDDHRVAHWLRQFGPAAVQAWAQELGIKTFVGSSGRVFPVGMKAAPLLRAWLHQLESLGVRLYRRHRWIGWDEAGHCLFETPAGTLKIGAPQGIPAVGGGTATVTVLALGGASWSRLGSDGQWTCLLGQREIPLAPWRPANCGFSADWSSFMRDKYAGTPLKNVALSLTGAPGQRWQGDCVITSRGIEGGLVYAASRALREGIERSETVQVEIDLLPQHSHAAVQVALSKPRGGDSLSNFLRRQLRLTGLKVALLNECCDAGTLRDTTQLATAIKALPLTIGTPAPLDEAISTAGGVRFEALDEQLMLTRMPGTFCAGEMLDWEAPTGGYLLTACLASGVVAGRGLLKYLGRATD